MSSSVVLDNVDDYLAPSQACINPLFQPPDAAKADDDKATRTTIAKVVPRRRRRRTPISDESKSSSTTTATGTGNGTKNKTETIQNEEGDKAATTSEQGKKDSVVKASIADCLACSGCVTTAETVLLEQRHSLQSLRQKLEFARGRSRTITISPHSWADICRHWNLSSSPSVSNSHCTDNRKNRIQDPFRLQFTTLLSQVLDADIVVDGSLPLQWTWLEEAQEFVELYRSRQRRLADSQQSDLYEEEKNDLNASKRKSPPLTSTAVDGTKTTYYFPEGTSKTVDNSKDEYDETSLPLISGSCPALVCLVEKSRSNLVPHLSRTQSPMSMMGSVLKRLEQDQNHENKIITKTATDTWDHWAIMPCHDKKLEASRQDFVFPNPKRSAVDLVITTSECVELIEEYVRSQKKDESHCAELTVASYLQDLPLAKQKAITEYHEVPSKAPTEATYLTTTSNSSLAFGNNDNTNKMVSKTQGAIASAHSSGSHADFIFLYAAHELFGCVLDTVSWSSAEAVNTGHDEPSNDSAASDSRKRVIKSARLARAQRQHYYKAQLFRQQDGTYSQTPSASSPVLEFSIAHGMQTMQRALTEALTELEEKSNSSASTMQYLEAMACPHGGCINGGGAISTRATTNGAIVRETPTETRQRVQKSLHYLELPPRPSHSGKPNGIGSRRTRYHAVPQMQHTLGATAGVKVEDIQW
ncbi:unnamed protein product [Cylindrotheca closterium]|uniref:Iron hydrogenase large subunit C-terminal domain-containing protein n=1 Tax=Cylindrotheca closterium TaxID=2856 RepID=A0AAD2G0S1_9STRA|nr:unnamed protein product [Cylindrotheca closterium]